MTQGESFSNSLYTDQMHLVERELSAFIVAVKTSYGPEEAQLSADDWIAESELMDSSPRSEVRNWRAVTIAASVRLAKRVNDKVHCRLYLENSLPLALTGCVACEEGSCIRINWKPKLGGHKNVPKH